MARSLALIALAFGVAAVATSTQAQTQPGPGGDRYGPSPVTAPSTVAYAARSPQGAPVLRTRVLSWPGKVARTVASSTPAVAPVAFAPRPAASPPVQPTPAAYSRPVGAWPPYRPVAQAPSAGFVAKPARQASAPQVASAADAPPKDWRPVFAGQPAAAAPQGGPGYTPAGAAYRAAPPARVLTADRRYGYDPTQDHSVRFYSVSRPFGLKPDPAPIPPQFFTATADLGADPPGPIPVDHVTAAGRTAVVSGSDTGGQ